MSYDMPMIPCATQNTKPMCVHIYILSVNTDNIIYAYDRRYSLHHLI